MKAGLPQRCLFSLIVLTNYASFLASAGPLQLISPRNPPPAAAAGGNGDSGPAIISADGRYVLFSSAANNLTLMVNSHPIPVLIPARINVYLRDRTNGTTTLVSVNQTGIGGGNGDSFATGISGNGQFALFESSATNLVIGDTNNATDVFVRDLVKGTNILVSVSTNGGFGNGNSGSAVMTPDGRYVAFVSSASNLATGDSNGIPDVYVRDLQLGTTMLASPGAMSAGTTAGSASARPVITPDGRYVAFYSSATNLVAGVTNVGDIYVRDLLAGTTDWASTGARVQLQAVFGISNGVCFSHKMSADGSLIAYEVSAAGYAKTAGVVLRYNLSSGQTDVVNTNANAPAGAYEDMRTIDLSPDGRFVASAANTDPAGLNTVVYLWDALTGTNLLVSADVSNAAPVSGSSYAPLVEASGRYVAFISNSTNLTPNLLTGESHLYYRDTLAGTTVLVDADTNGAGVGVNPETYPSLSPDGQLLAFESDDAQDRNRYLNVLIYNLQSNATELVSIQNPVISSQTPDGPSIFSSTAPVSLNGQYVAFASEADNVVANDMNGVREVYVRDLNSGTNILVSADTNGLPAAGISSEASISGDGRYVVFSSSAASLVPGDANSSEDVFERDLQNGTTTLVSVNMNGQGPGNSNSYSPIMSNDGRFVLFRSQAQNLAPGSFGNGIENLFLRDLQLGTNYTLTADTGTTYPLPPVSAWWPAAMTPDGHYVAFIGRIAGSTSPYLYVWDSRLAMLVYTNTTASLAQVAISPDGQRLAYSTAPSGSSGLYIADRANPANNATVGTGSSGSFSTQSGWNFSADGSLLVYETRAAIASMDANNLNDVYLYDVLAKTNFLVSHNLSGTGAGDGASDSPVFSPDGRFVAYRSAADNLAPGDSNGVSDVFIYDRTSGATTLLTASQFGNRSADNRSANPFFSGDGQTLVFQSAASDLVGTNDWNRASDLFAFNLYAAGMIPTFYVQVSPAASPNQNPTLIWPVLSGKIYQVQFKNNLTDPAWQTLPGNVTILGSTGYFTDTTPVTGQRFYQIIGF
jgi:Tol biopolymer transport system component